MCIIIGSDVVKHNNINKEYYCTFIGVMRCFSFYFYHFTILFDVDMVTRSDANIPNKILQVVHMLINIVFHLNTRKK